MAILSGALLPLTYPANFEEYGTLTPDETASQFQAMLDQMLDRQSCLYASRILATSLDNLVAYWRLNERFGTLVSDSSGAGCHAVSSGASWGAAGVGDGDTSVSLDGSNDLINLYSTSLRDAFDGAAGTLMVWAKVSGAGVWSDGAIRPIARLYADGNNYIYLFKDTDGTTKWRYRAGGVTEPINKSITSADWLCLALTWDKAADEMKAYYNGTQEGGTQTGLGTWAGSLASNYSVFGTDAASGGNYFWSGFLAHAALWDAALDDDQLVYLANLL